MRVWQVLLVEEWRVIILQHSFIISDIVIVLIKIIGFVLELFQLNLVDILPDLLSKKLLKLLANPVFVRKLPRQQIGIISLLDQDIVIVAIA